MSSEPKQKLALEGVCLFVVFLFWLTKGLKKGLVTLAAFNWDVWQAACSQVPFIMFIGISCHVTEYQNTHNEVFYNCSNF